MVASVSAFEGLECSRRDHTGTVTYGAVENKLTIPGDNDAKNIQSKYKLMQNKN